MDFSDETVIGEGVVLDTASASLGSRAAASLIDVVVIGAVAIGSLTLLGLVVPAWTDEAMLAAIYLTTLVGIFIGIPVTLETLSRGRSVGKWALGIRIVRDDGGPVGFRQALVRGLAAFVELWMVSGAIALVASVTNKRGKRVGDMLAGTYALQARAAKHQHLVLTMPFTLAPWAASADVRRLPDGLALEVRQFLTRANLLHPMSRRELGEDLARRVRPYVSPQPPVEAHPETFLTAVLVIRRDKEFALQSRQLQADAAQAVAIHRLPHQVPDVLD